MVDDSTLDELLCNLTEAEQSQVCRSNDPIDTLKAIKSSRERREHDREYEELLLRASSGSGDFNGRRAASKRKLPFVKRTDLIN